MSVKALKRLSVEASGKVFTSTITIGNHQRGRQINLRLLKRITNALLADLKIEDAELGIHMVAMTEMTRLNEKFLRHRGSTDVITFDYTNQGGQCFVTAPTIRATTKRCPPLHGEIFICVDEAVVQAKKFETDWQSEVVRYLIHGVLHLLGYNDARPAARRRMKRGENRLLRQFSRRFSLAQLGHTAKLAGCKSP